MTEAERAAKMADQIEDNGYVDFGMHDRDEMGLIVSALRAYSTTVSTDAELREVVALNICNSERGPNPKFHLKSFDDELAWSIGADMYRHKADAALSAIHASGWRVVPAELTDAMVKVGVEYRLRTSVTDWYEDTKRLWRVMRDAGM